MNDQSNNHPTTNRVSNESIVREWFGGQASGSLPTGAQDSESLMSSLTSLLHNIKENKWLISALAVLGLIGGFVKAVSETPIYQANLTMAVEPSSSLYGTQALFDPYAYRFYETQYELLKSRSVAQRVVERLNLVERPEISKLLVKPGLFESLASEFQKFFGVSYQIIPDVSEGVVPTSEAERERTKRWLTYVVQSGVSVSGGEKTNLVSVTYRSINPNFSAEVANALVEAYIEQGLDSQANRSQQTTRWLSQRIEELKSTLDLSQSKLQEFLVAEDMLDSQSEISITTDELRTLRSEFLEARSNLDELQKRYGALHPRITEARSELQATKTRLDTKERSISLNRQKQIELDQLEREVESNKELYEAFLNKFKEADLSSSGSQVARARIVDRALPPGGPIHPNKERIISLWTVGGVLLGIGLAFLRAQLDSTFKNARVVETKLGLPLLGVVQLLKKEVESVERHYLDNTRSVFSESINHIRTGIMYSDVDNPPKVIVITSSVQSEGKTTLASNLALSYAQLGKTLLIDADLRRPRIKNIVDTGAKFGLVDYVAGAAELKDCVKKDPDEPRLYILKSGTTPPNPLELLSSDRFKTIMDDFKKVFDHIIIDTAPVLPASDAVVLGRLCDSLLLAIQSERTTHHMARDALKRLHSSKVKVAGLILTQANIKKDNPYAYGGYYGYGAYAYVEDSRKI